MKILVIVFIITIIGVINIITILLLRVLNALNFKIIKTGIKIFHVIFSKYFLLKYFHEN